MKGLVVVVAGLAAAAIAALAGGDRDSESPPLGTGASRHAREQAPPPPRYRPVPAEQYPEGKRLAARIAQRATTYPPGSTPASVARAVGRSTAGDPPTEAAIAPLVERDSRSRGEIVYPQLSGVTANSLGAMVVVRQTRDPEDGDEESVVRVIDVRLGLVGGRWVLDQIGEVGGEEASRPDDLSPAAERLLGDPGIRLSDSARWDIYRGAVDESLLEALADAGERFDFAVGVIDSGHPQNVWATDRQSAHSAGYAADIYAVEGRLVIDQRGVGTPAYDLASTFARDTTQLGSPWVFGAGSFTDAVHQDHLHYQRSRLP